MSRRHGPKSEGSPWKSAPARRRHLKATLGYVGLTALAAAIAWGVTRGLDEGEDAVRRDPPVLVTVDTNPARVFAGHPPWQTYSFVSPSAPKELGEPPSSRCRDWRSWGQNGGGVDADASRAYAFLQGRPGTAVVIDSVEVEVLRRRPPLPGTHAYCPAGGATASPTLIDIDLDENPPAVLYAHAGDDLPARERLLLTLSGPDTETLEIVGRTRRCDCEWRLRVLMIVNGKRYERVVDDGGRPFRTTASDRARHRMWDGARWARMSRAEWRQTLPVDWKELAGRQPPP